MYLNIIGNQRKLFSYIIIFIEYLVYWVFKMISSGRTMKKGLLLIMLLLTVETVIMHSQELQYTPSVSMGDVEAGSGCKTVVVHFVNTSNHTITLNDITAVKPFVTVGASSLAIAAGATAGIAITFNPDGLAGVVNNAVRFHTSTGPDRPSYIRIQAVVRTPVEIRPVKHYSAFLTATLNTYEFEIVNRTNESIRINEFKVEPERITVFDREPFSLAPGETKRVSVEIIPDEAKSLMLSLRLKTSLGVCPEVFCSLPLRPLE